MAKLTAVLAAALLILLVLTEADSRRRGKSWREKGRDRARQRHFQRDGRSKHRDRSADTRQSSDRLRNPFHGLLTSFHDVDPFSYFNFRWNVESREDPWWEGPNVCENESKEIVNNTDTGSEIMRHYSTTFQSCDESETAYKCKMVQQDQHGRKELTVVYECCHGYSREKGDFGCPNKVSVVSLLEKAEELGLTDFVKAVKTLKLTREIETGNFTIFVPENGAFSLDSDLIDAGTGLILKDAPAVIAISEPSIDRALKSLQNAILSHMIAGAIRSSSMDDEKVLETGNPEGGTIRINYFVRPDKIMTANCVQVTTRDHIASNGVIHTLSKVLKPVTETLLELVKTRPELSTLKTILASANYVSKLDKDGQFTLLAPTNNAFERMNSKLRERLLAGDKTCLEKVLQNHLLPNVICSSAILGNGRTPNILNGELNVSRNEDNKVFIAGSQMIVPDVMATNGVMHIIDDVLVPDEALGLLELLEKEGFTELLRMVEKAGLTKMLESSTNVTFFVPTNEAFQKLPIAVKTKLNEDPELLKKLLNFHVSPGVKECRNLHDNELLSTLAQTDIRINNWSMFPYQHHGVTKTAQCVPIVQMNIDACNGRINLIESVMIPPKGNVLDVLALDKKFSTLVSLIKKSGLADSLQEADLMTIFAPNNEAFEKMDQDDLSSYGKDPEKLEKLLKRHLFADNLCCAGIFRHQWYEKAQVKTLSDDYLRLSRTHDNIPKVGNAHVVKCDQTATNGNVLEIDRVLLHEFHRHRWRYNPFADWDRF